MAYMYILKSLKNGRYYIGSTNNLERRLKEHNAGKMGYTKRYRPWKIYYTEEYKNAAEAKKRERQVKSWKKRVMIEKLKCL